MIFKFELNPLDNEKDISLYVLFRIFQDISVTHIRCVGKVRIEALKGKIFNLMKITKIATNLKILNTLAYM
jgi:hypothetical protein